jgi:hypothetical protein
MAGQKKESVMIRRIFAWALLIGFVLLVANILVIGYQRTLSAVIYIVIVLAFLFTIKTARKN